MTSIKVFLVLCFFILCNTLSISAQESNKTYEAKWESLDNRPIPSWYDDAKFGIFIHWGVFSVPSFSSEWFWNHWKDGSQPAVDFMNKNYKPGFTYQDFAVEFTAEFYNATQWSKIFEASGAQYVVLTAKHHEGYTLWPSTYSYSWNSKDVGPHRDLLGELATAIRSNTNLTFGVYHSLFEWYNPLYQQDKKNNFSTDNFVTNKVWPEIKELINTYKPEVLWSDGEWEASEDYWKSKELLAWLYNESPVKDTIVTNDRWGLSTRCKHGDYYNCADHYNPGVLQSHKWENAMTIDKQSWGYRRISTFEDYSTLKELIKELVVTVSTNGNLLLNVGPTKDGIIAPIMEERLREIGSWLKINGDAIYKTKVWTLQNDTITSDVWYTQSKSTSDLYAIILTWPNDNIVKLSPLLRTTNATTVSILNSPDTKLEWVQNTDDVQITLPIVAQKAEPAWVLRFTNLI